MKLKYVRDGVVQDFDIFNNRFDSNNFVTVGTQSILDENTKILLHCRNNQIIDKCENEWIITGDITLSETIWKSIRYFKR